MRALCMFPGCGSEANGTSYYCDQHKEATEKREMIKEEDGHKSMKGELDEITKLHKDSHYLFAKVLERCSHSMDSKMLVAIVRMQERLRGSK